MRYRELCRPTIRIPFSIATRSQLDLPYRNNFKLNGSYLFGYGIRAGATLQSYAGGPLTVTWTPPASVFPKTDYERSRSRTVDPARREVPRSVGTSSI